MNYAQTARRAQQPGDNLSSVRNLLSRRARAILAGNFLNFNPVLCGGAPRPQQNGPVLAGGLRGATRQANPAGACACGCIVVRTAQLAGFVGFAGFFYSGDAPKKIFLFDSKEIFFLERATA